MATFPEKLGSAPAPQLPMSVVPHVSIRPAKRLDGSRVARALAVSRTAAFLIWRDIKVRYKQTALGAAWAILQPVFTMVVFSLFFGRLAKVPSDGVPYPVFAYCALLPWQLFAYALAESSNSVVANQRLITKMYFPRLVIPIAGVLAGLVDFAIAFVVLILLMLYYGIVPTWPCYAAAVRAAGRHDRAGGGPVAFRAERAVPRRALHGRLS